MGAVNEHTSTYADHLQGDSSRSFHCVLEVLTQGIEKRKL